jgi:hypothetical protein
VGLSKDEVAEVKVATDAYNITVEKIAESKVLPLLIQKRQWKNCQMEV